MYDVNGPIIRTLLLSGEGDKNTQPDPNVRDREFRYEAVEDVYAAGYMIDKANIPLNFSDSTELPIFTLPAYLDPVTGKQTEKPVYLFCNFTAENYNEAGTIVSTSQNIHENPVSGAASAIPYVAAFENQGGGTTYRYPLGNETVFRDIRHILNASYISIPHPPSGGIWNASELSPPDDHRWKLQNLNMVPLQLVPSQIMGKINRILEAGSMTNPAANNASITRYRSLTLAFDTEKNGYYWVFQFPPNTNDETNPALFHNPFFIWPNQANFPLNQIDRTKMQVTFFLGHFGQSPASLQTQSFTAAAPFGEAPPLSQDLSVIPLQVSTFRDRPELCDKIIRQVYKMLRAFGVSTPSPHSFVWSKYFRDPTTAAPAGNAEAFKKYSLATLSLGDFSGLRDISLSNCGLGYSLLNANGLSFDATVYGPTYVTYAGGPPVTVPNPALLDNYFFRLEAPFYPTRIFPNFLKIHIRQLAEKHLIPNVFMSQSINSSEKKRSYDQISSDVNKDGTVVEIISVNASMLSAPENTPFHSNILAYQSERSAKSSWSALGPTRIRKFDWWITDEFDNPISFPYQKPNLLIKILG